MPARAQNSSSKRKESREWHCPLCFLVPHDDRDPRAAASTTTPPDRAGGGGRRSCGEGHAAVSSDRSLRVSSLAASVTQTSEGHDSGSPHYSGFRPWPR